jgi:hypothetical protein
MRQTSGVASLSWQLRNAIRNVSGDWRLRRPGNPISKGHARSQTGAGVPFEDNHAAEGC